VGALERTPPERIHSRRLQASFLSRAIHGPFSQTDERRPTQCQASRWGARFLACVALDDAPRRWARCAPGTSGDAIRLWDAPSGGRALSAGALSPVTRPLSINTITGVGYRPRVRARAGRGGSSLRRRRPRRRGDLRGRAGASGKLPRDVCWMRVVSAEDNGRCAVCA
jgi:hypothetical protein